MLYPRPLIQLSVVHVHTAELMNAHPYTHLYCIVCIVYVYAVSHTTLRTVVVNARVNRTHAYPQAYAVCLCGHVSICHTHRRPLCLWYCGSLCTRKTNEHYKHWTVCIELYVYLYGVNFCNSCYSSALTSTQCSFYIS